MAKASCNCGQLSVVVVGEPMRVSVYQTRCYDWVSLDGIDEVYD
ncbi:hypothetical protein [Shewanella pealeana]|nr:hypothetical protein [Shewanella pealeana]